MNRRRARFFVFSICLAVCQGSTSFLRAQVLPVVELEDSVTIIWDQGPHNAFTDLTRYNDRWYCVFREASQHNWAEDAKVMVLSSTDGNNWTLDTTIYSPADDKPDIRDPKITITPDGQLMLTAAIASIDGSIYQTYAWFSSDGLDWDDPVQIGDDYFWIWRVTWVDTIAYGIGYVSGFDSPSPGGFIRLYTSTDGIHFSTYVDTLLAAGRPTESSLLFLPNGRAWCLTRDDSLGAWLGQSQSPYDEWTWANIGTPLSGQQLILLPDGKIVIAGRLLAPDTAQRTSLLLLDEERLEMPEVLELPSGGDTGYPGMFFYQDTLWVSYYSSHGGKASIYLAKVTLSSDLGNGMANSDLPEALELQQNYPNPFNLTTTITYQLPADGQVEIVIYDTAGRRVRQLINRRERAGHRLVVWDGRDDRGYVLSSGLYIYSITANNIRLSRRMILLK